MQKPFIPHYEFVEAGDDNWAIKLLDSELAGITYRYGTIKFLGEDEEGNGRMSFEYDIIDAGPFKKEELVGEKINTILGNILTEVIIESLKEKEALASGNNREDDTEKFSIE